MRLLLDTHVLIWALAMPDKLRSMTRAMIEDTDNEVLFSAASIWEVAIKSSLRRSGFIIRPEEIISGAIEAGFTELSIGAAVAAKVSDLPLHHRDPFDRLLVAQAMADSILLLTADTLLLPYSDLVILVQ